ncbi:MAG: hypothetical protein KIT81_09635 [Alphaproteobacteria bacterium]|nr:hypothetical protein [Alphaproteobacteria bacterium]MCW5751396.1 hypothetical protein [Alphaproteobacteria bacterium]
MERIAFYADISVRRGCGFAALAIGATMMGLSGDLLLALKSGAVLTTLMDAVLMLMAANALRRDLRGTELWALLGRRHGLAMSEERALGIVRMVLHDTLLRYSRWTLLSAGLLWVLALTVWASRTV